MNLSKRLTLHEMLREVSGLTPHHVTEWPEELEIVLFSLGCQGAALLHCFAKEKYHTGSKDKHVISSDLFYPKKLLFFMRAFSKAQ